MQLFPNPSKGRVRMSWSEMCDGTIRIVGLDGKEQKNIPFVQADSLELSTDDLTQGCYTVMRLGKDGAIMETKKLIVK